MLSRQFKTMIFAFIIAATFANSLYAQKKTKSVTKDKETTTDSIQKDSEKEKDPEDVVVAVVAGKNITLDQLQEAFAVHLLEPSSKKISPETVLNDLINREVTSEQATKEGLDKEPLIQNRMKEVLQSAYVTKNLAEEVSKIEVTDKEVEKYYRDNKEYRTSSILIRVQAIPSPQELKAAYDKIESIYMEANQKPEKFEELAKNHSQTANRDLGGEMGFLPAPSLAPEYYEAIKGKSVGHITPPFRTQFGYHIAKVTGIKDYKDINKDLYKKIIFDQKRDALVDDFYKDLRKKTSVKIFKEKIKM
ncbi:MAG: peptidylprolyl isomerase [Bacteriovoracaceae bacterium]|nr:peptidylprolyl isomerase [Bacteriovoracaceae bacterium]